ncbi:aromatic amino acid transaminase [Aestuariispira insulae]|uniref:Aspartate aminotransferase/aromatic-amino-acid transaminase n=1 Tax=Aestuariispira insulae TaxID=1461337 RepID=A0A3D9H8M6_9PROT|nr:amino acid aminotransferase [Aestuariispira insulae]RED45838.1 aspartate aminotransferase/aromatic-amino-acid transaminase [Aestuariispira insulae]
MFNEIKEAGVDNLMALMQQFKEDPRTEKVDLVVGVYKNDAGDVPVLDTVKAAERHLLEEESSKNYVGVMGDPALAEIMPALLLGADSPLIAESRVKSLQTPGGCGALKVGFDFLNTIKPGNRVWVSTPTWANHIPTIEGAGLTVAQYPYFRPADRSLDFDAMVSHLSTQAKAGDVILLHACCHNPTGVDLSLPQWQAITDLVLEKGLLPFVDCAYQGFGTGLEEDVAGLRHMAARVPEMLIASSFSKNFAIYRERTGALTLMGENATATANAMKAVVGIVRTNYSMPPSHGARIVTTIMNDPDLKAKWLVELEEMRSRIAGNRATLRKKLEERQVGADISFLTDQTGMFSYTGFNPDQVKRLREEFGIFTAGDGRINVAGLSSGNMDMVAEGFAAILR